jgi:hypothetical protein
MSFNLLSKNEQIALYLHDNPVALSQELMLYIATHYMNIGYIRKRIKQLYPKIVKNIIQDNNFVLIPDHYVQNKE